MRLSPGYRTELIIKKDNSLQLKSLNLPYFGGCVLIYSLGLLLNLLLVGGNLPHILGLILGVVVFWLVWVSSKKTVYLHYICLGLVTLLSIVGLIAAANLDHDYLRSNPLSDEILKIARLIIPQIEDLNR